MRAQTRRPLTRQKIGVNQAARRYETIKHLPRALELANERAERWKFRFLTVMKQRDIAQAKVDAVQELYDKMMKWDGDPRSKYGSSPRTRQQIAQALGIDHPSVGADDD